MSFAYDPDLINWMKDQLHPPWWRKAAACQGADTDLFFIERGASSKRAKAICAQCPVLNPCLDLAIEGGFRQGIFGGMSERERRAEKKRRRLAAQVA